MSATLTPTPLPSLTLSTHPIPSTPTLPNTTPHSHPLFIYHHAYPPSTTPQALESHLKRNNINPQWRYTMYTTTHYHSTTHEILCVFQGRAKLLFGGEENPGRVEIVVGSGDAMVVPAGVGHRLVEDFGVDGGFLMVGGYPEGCEWDMCYGTEGEGGRAEACAGVEWLGRDPLYGDDGPVLWSKERVKEHQEQRGKDE